MTRSVPATPYLLLAEGSRFPLDVHFIPLCVSLCLFVSFFSPLSWPWCLKSVRDSVNLVVSLIFVSVLKKEGNVVQKQTGLPHSNSMQRPTRPEKPSLSAAEWRELISLEISRFSDVLPYVEKFQLGKYQIMLIRDADLETQYSSTVTNSACFSLL